MSRPTILSTANIYRNPVIGALLKHVPVLVGVILVYSGVYKAIYPGEATLALVALGPPMGVARIAIGALTCIELWLGIVLIFGVNRRVALWAATGLMLSFSLFLFYLSTMAHPPSCGCLGLTGAFSSNRQAALFGLGRNCLILWVLRGAYDYYYPASTATSLERGAP
jgi:hypothetical protein